MNTPNKVAGFDTRAFVDAIRAGLDAAGHRDVAISRQWVDLDTPGERLLINVPVGPTMRVPLRLRSGELDTGDADALAREASYFAQALVNLKRAERSLAAYAKAVRRAVVAVIEDARHRDLDVQLADFGFAPVRAGHLSGRDWKDAAEHVLCTAVIRHTSFFLQPRTTSVVIGQPEDAAAELRDTLEEQIDRQARLAQMDGRGADLEVDAITLDILQACGLDAEETLRAVWRDQCVNVTLPAADSLRSLSVISSDGRVTATVVIEDRAVWNGECLWFLDEAQDAGLRGREGRMLGDLLAHPVFASRRVEAVDQRHGAGRTLVRFDLSDKLLFDGDTGRIWPEQKRLAD